MFIFFFIAPVFVKKFKYKKIFFLNIYFYFWFFASVFIAWSLLQNTTLKQALRKAFGEEKGKSDEGGNDIAIIIGPEGGFEPTEVESVLKNSPAAKSVSLGKRILRTETAGMAMLAMLMYELEG